MSESSGSQGDPLLALSVGRRGWSATVWYLGPSEADFSESPQIACLAPERANHSRKKIFGTTVGRSTTPSCLRPARPIFEKLAKSHIWLRNAYFHTEKKFQPYSRSVNDSRVPLVTADRFFRISPNRIFGSQRTNLAQKKFHYYSGAVGDFCFPRFK